MTEIAYYYRFYWDEYYGIMSSLAFTIMIAVFSVVGGIASDNYNGKTILIISSLCWSLCTLFSGMVTNFWNFFSLQVMLGFF